MGQKKDQLQKGRGKVKKEHLYSFVFVPNGKYTFTNTKYIDSTDNDPVFYMIHDKINGKNQAVISNHTDRLNTSSWEGNYGMLWFTRVDDFTFKAHSNGSEKVDLTIKLEHPYMDQVFIGKDGYYVSGEPDVSIQIRDTSKTSNVSFAPSIVDDDKSVLRPITVSLETTTDTISSSDDYIDISGYTTSDSKSRIPNHGFATIHNGSVTEYVLITFYDPVSEKIKVKRGQCGTTARNWSGNYYIDIENKNHPDNYEKPFSVSNLMNGLDVYVVPHPRDAYFTSYFNLDLAYDYSEFLRAKTVYTYETGKTTFKYPWGVNHYLFLKKEYPAKLTTSTHSKNSKTVIKGGKEITDNYFTDPYEADQGFLYDYCESSQNCGPCMGNVRDEVNTCLVKADAWNVDEENDKKITEDNNYDSKNKNWNKKNKTDNQTISFFGGLAVLGTSAILLFAYIGVAAQFTSNSKNGYYVDYDFTQEMREYRFTIILLGILTAIIFLGTASWTGYSMLHKPGSDKDRFFPIINYNRGVYNPPPGYTFQGAPSQS